MSDPTGRMIENTCLVRGIKVYSRSWDPPDKCNAPPVILVHGLGVSGRYMVPTAALLADAGLRVFVPDLPGTGRSEKPRAVSTVQDLADDLAAFMDVADIGTAQLVGNSYGCQVIAELCLRHPGRVSRIVLLGPTIDIKARTPHQQLGRLLIDAVREPPSMLLIAAVDYLRFGLIRYVRTFYHALGDHIEDKLPAITVPALVVRGERDPIAPQEWVELLASLLPHGTAKVVVGGPHSVNHVHPHPFVTLIEPFLKNSN